METGTKKYIAYYRVSTKKQGESGLGLEAQKEQVRRFVNCSDCILAEFTEVESGKKDNRPQLNEAIRTAKEKNATLVIAKLDRLSRNASFIFALRDAKIDFVAVDMPDANSLTIGIMAVLAQDERERTSKRTKDALKAKKARANVKGTKEHQKFVTTGRVLGTPENLTSEARAKGMQVRISKAANKASNRQAIAMIENLRKDGLSMQKIADRLNSLEMKTSRGGKFHASTVKMLLDRA